MIKPYYGKMEFKKNLIDKYGTDDPSIELIQKIKERNSFLKESSLDIESNKT